MFPSKDVVVITPAPEKVSLFSNRVFADGQVKMRSLGWALKQYNWKRKIGQGHSYRENAM